MPRPFTEAERFAIRGRLLKAARGQFTRFGYRKTSIAGIAHEAGIGKGSVYLFFESKADLFMAVAEIVEGEVRAAFLDDARGLSGAEPGLRLEHLLTFHVEALNREPFLRVALDPVEAASLFREIPPSLAAAHQHNDVVFFEQLLAGWSGEGTEIPVDPAVLMSVLRALYVVFLHEDLVGGDTVRDVVSLLTSGVARVLASPGPQAGGS